MAERYRDEAIDAVQEQLHVAQANRQPILAATGNKWGNGIFVGAVGKSPDDEFVWLVTVADGKDEVFAIGREDLTATPRVRLSI